MLLKPETTPEELNSSSVLDQDVLKEMKKRREAPNGCLLPCRDDRSCRRRYDNTLRPAESEEPGPWTPSR
ncbi:hypothetical protein PC116_g7498 [Phytophthora cactorum]|nr:hypothetical protein PC116_g7498 [Phytophthora cactorum]